MASRPSHAVKGRPIHLCPGLPCPLLHKGFTLDYPRSPSSSLHPSAHWSVSLACEHANTASVLKKTHTSLLPFPKQLLERVVHTGCSFSFPPVSLQPTPLGLLSPSLFQNSYQTHNLCCQSSGHDLPNVLISQQLLAQVTTSSFSKYLLLLASVPSCHRVPALH